MRNYLLSTLFLATIWVNAQETTPTDALRFGMTDITGTARFRALSGAFGAVGGDISAINVNPAGSAIFNANSGTITLANFNTKNNSSYFGSNTTSSENTLDLNQLGAVFVFKNQDKSDWKKITVALGYENTNNFDNYTFSSGTNPNNSISNYFLNFANSANGGTAIPVALMETQSGESITDLYTYLASLPNGSYPNISGFAAQQAMLGYQAFLYNYDAVNNIYNTNVPANGTYYQENVTATWGFGGKFTANLATQYKDKLFLGMNLNVHFTDYRKSSSVYESNNSPDITKVQALQFDNELYTYGGGFSFNLGMIAKVTEQFRAGIAYESPTWYQLNDELSQRVVGYSIDNGTVLNPDYVSPGVINIYEPYNLQTPGKFTGSLAYIFGKSGFISFDYALKDYSQTKFCMHNDTFFRNLNNNMSGNLAVSNEFRLGAEYRIKQLSLRGGYRFEESPYKNNKTIGNLMGYSAGLGYNFGGSRLDFTYSFSERDSDAAFVSSGMNDAARINTKNNTVLLSYTAEF